MCPSSIRQRMDRPFLVIEPDEEFRDRTITTIPFAVTTTFGCEDESSFASCLFYGKSRCRICQAALDVELAAYPVDKLTFAPANRAVAIPAEEAEVAAARRDENFHVGRRFQL